MKIKAVLFDLDGTLVDSNDLHVLAWEHAFAEAGLRFGRQVIHDQIGKGADMLVPALLPGADEAEVGRLGEAHDEAFKTRFLDKVRPFPNARDLLAHTVGCGQKVVLASSASKEDLDHYLDLLDARRLVSAMTSADDVRNTKPAPDIFAAALSKVSPLRAWEVMVVGDTPYDVEAAGKCGIAAIGLRSGKFADEALLEAGAIALYDGASALLSGYARSPLAGPSEA